jgi:hypothetical protein
LNLFYNDLVRHYKRLPRQWRLVMTVVLILLMFSQALDLGEKLGKMLYYLTHP